MKIINIINSKIIIVIMNVIIISSIINNINI